MYHGTSALARLEFGGKYACTVSPISNHLLSGCVVVQIMCYILSCLHRMVASDVDWSRHSSYETLQTIMYSTHEMTIDDPIIELPPTLPTNSNAVDEKMVS